jgi:hypothetical protein
MWFIEKSWRRDFVPPAGLRRVLDQTCVKKWVLLLEMTKSCRFQAEMRGFASVRIRNLS